MTSRKRANGKKKRAAKAKAKVAVAAQNQPLQGGRQMQTIDTDRSDGAQCDHGLVPSHYHWTSHREILDTYMNQCKVFLQAFVDEFDGAGGDFLAAYHATKEKFVGVWKDFGKMSFVVSFLLACGTSKVLEGNARIARKYAALSSYFEMYVEVDLLNTRAYPSWAKINELYSADMHTLVSFLKKRIRCSCLDELYKEVKSIPKIGLCCNTVCPLPCGKTNRSATKCCSRCRAANYCSRECQVAAWQGHKGECAFYADLKAKFESEQE
eukprot:scaffold18382_cov155-Skeletonema_dohrnii-CCMP3373.AAC.9